MAPIIAPNIIRLTVELVGRAFVIKYKKEVIKITIAPETAPQKIWVTRPLRNKSFRNFNISDVIIGNEKRPGPYDPGSKPSYIRAACHEHAIPLYNSFIEYSQKFLSKPVVSGKFGSDMQIELINDGPVTIWIDSKNRE